MNNDVYKHSWEDRLLELDKLKSRISSLEKTFHGTSELMEKVEESLISEADPVRRYGLQKQRETLEQEINRYEAELSAKRQTYREKANSCYKDRFLFLIQKEHTDFSRNDYNLSTSRSSSLTKFQKRYGIANSDAASIRAQVIQSYRQQARYVQPQSSPLEDWNGYIIGGISFLALVIFGFFVSSKEQFERNPDGWIFLGTVNAAEVSGNTLAGLSLRSGITIETPSIPSLGDVVTITRTMRLREKSDDSSRIIREIPAGDKVLVLKVSSLFDEGNSPGIEEVWAEVQHCKESLC